MRKPYMLAPASCLVILLVASVAQAQPESAREASRARFERGVEHIAAGRFAEAVSELEAARSLYATASVHYNLGLAYRGRLPGWLLSLSVVIDMALLLGLIWSFHLQYNQPPSFYLKAPTLLYVFIFIALRALRFEARYVVMSGLVAAIGWGFMIGYVVVAEVGNPMITRDYITAKRTTTDPAVRDEIIPISTPARYTKPGYYPDAYRITYDTQAKEYRIALTQLAPRN